MADTKVSDLPALNGVDVDPADLLYIVDSSAGAAGSKKITVGQYQVAPYSAGTANGVMYLNGSNVVTTGSGLTFDGSNLGLGVTPSAWSGYGTPVLELPEAGTIVTAGPNATWGANWYYSGGSFLYKTSFAASYYSQNSGQHRWYSSTGVPSAGSSITFTQAMTLDASGNLGLGATPSAWTSTYKAFAAGSVNSNFSGFWDGTTAITTVATGGAVIGGSWTYTMSGQAVTRYAQTGGGAHQWYTAPSGTAGNAISFTQAMTLDANGTLTVKGIGAGNGNLIFDDPGTAIVSAQGTAGSVLALNGRSVITFTTGGTPTGTERARITSGGDLLVGTLTVAGAGGITLFNNSGPGFSLVNNNNAAATGYVFESFRRSSVEIGSITQNGTTAVLYNTTSDRRLKNNIIPAPSASDVIDAIQIVSHDWKAAPDEHVKYGVIAQDLHAVAPQAVLQGDDGDEIEKTWGVDYSKLVPMLIKEIQSLRARVAALEAQ